jgi:hypothetical protein
MLRGARGEPRARVALQCFLDREGEITAFITLRHASLGTIFYRALRCEPSPPLRRALWHESRGPGCVSMVCRLLVMSGLMMLGRFPVVASGMRQMF